MNISLPEVGILLTFIGIFVLALTIVLRWPSSEIKDLASSSFSILAFIALLIIALIFVFLANSASWVSDLIKVGLGLIGGLAASVSITKSQTAGRDISQQIANGQNVLQSLNAHVDELFSELTQIKDAVFQQAAKSDDFSSALYLGNTSITIFASDFIKNPSQLRRFSASFDYSGRAQEGFPVELSDALANPLSYSKRSYLKNFFDDKDFQESLSAFLEHARRENKVLQTTGWDNISRSIDEDASDDIREPGLVLMFRVFYASGKIPNRTTPFAHAMEEGYSIAEGKDWKISPRKAGTGGD